MDNYVLRMAALAVGMALASSAALASPVFYTFEGQTSTGCVGDDPRISALCSAISVQTGAPSVLSQYIKPVAFVLEVDVARLGEVTIGGTTFVQPNSPDGRTKSVYAHLVGGSLPFGSQSYNFVDQNGVSRGIAEYNGGTSYQNGQNFNLGVGSITQIVGSVSDQSGALRGALLQNLLPGYGVLFIDHGTGVFEGTTWYGAVAGAAFVTSVSNVNPLINPNLQNSAGAGTIASPFLPVSSGSVVEPSFRFVAPVFAGQNYSFDPVVATGYDYVVNSGPNIASVSLPDIGDGIFDVMWGWNGTSFTNVSSLLAGDIFNFGGVGVDRFRVSGIDTAAALDPANPLAFVTNLTFAGTGSVDLSQTPITTNVTATVPEPESAFLFGAGILGLVAARRRSQMKTNIC